MAIRLTSMSLVLLCLPWIGACAPEGAESPAPRAPATAAPSRTALRDSRAASALIAALPLQFEQNVGQLHPNVQFQVRGGQSTVFFTREDALLVLTRQARRSPREAVSESAKTAAVRWRFPGSNSEPEVVGLGRQGGPTVYFKGDDPAKWGLAAPNFAKVQYNDLYPGIDLVYYGTAGSLEYDFVVRPGADHRQIRVAYEGVERLTVDDAGNLLLHTTHGVVTQRAPVIYQMAAGQRKRIDGAYTLLAAREVGFRLSGAFDAKAAVTIDPVVDMGSFLGTLDNDFGVDVRLDWNGRILIGGDSHDACWFPGEYNKHPSLAYEKSSHFLCDGGYGTKYGDLGHHDVFLAMLNASATDIVWSAIVGGKNDDRLYTMDQWIKTVEGIPGIAPTHCMYLGGKTMAPNFPLKSSYQTGCESVYGSYDAFVTKLCYRGRGTAAPWLVFSTRMRGATCYFANGDDVVYAIDVDNDGNAYVGGITQSFDFPVTANAPQKTKSPPDPWNDDGLVMKLSSGGALLYSTFLGGNSIDYVFGVAHSPSGDIVAVGSTQSTNFPLKASFKSQLASGDMDAFVTMYASNGALSYSTLLGGSAFDSAADVIWYYGPMVVGETWSTNFPVKTSANPGLAHRGGGDGFVAHIAWFGGLYSSLLLGGAEDDRVTSISSDADSVYVTGTTSSSNFTGAYAWGYPGPIPVGYKGGVSDAFVVKLGWDLSKVDAIKYSKYIGGSGTDEGKSVYASGGLAYVVGTSNSPTIDFGSSTASFERNSRGKNDAFVVRVAP